MRGKGYKVSLRLSSPSCRVRVSSVQLLEVKVKGIQGSREKDVHQSGWELTRAPAQRRGKGEWFLANTKGAPRSPFPICPHLSSWINTQAVSLKKFLKKFNCMPDCERYICCCLLLLSRFSHGQLCATLWIVLCQAPLCMEFSRQEY